MQHNIVRHQKNAPNYREPQYAVSYADHGSEAYVGKDGKHHQNIEQHNIMHHQKMHQQKI